MLSNVKMFNKARYSMQEGVYDIVKRTKDLRSNSHEFESQFFLAKQGAGPP